MHPPADLKENSKMASQYLMSQTSADAEVEKNISPKHSTGEIA